MQMGRWLRPNPRVGEEEEEAEKEYQVDVLPDRLKSSRSSRAPSLRSLSRLADDVEGGFLRGHIAHPDNEYVPPPCHATDPPPVPSSSANSSLQIRRTGYMATNQ